MFTPTQGLDGVPHLSYCHHPAGYAALTFAWNGEPDDPIEVALGVGDTVIARLPADDVASFTGTAYVLEQFAVVCLTWTNIPAIPHLARDLRPGDWFRTGGLSPQRSPEWLRVERVSPHEHGIRIWSPDHEERPFTLPGDVNVEGKRPPS